MRTSLSSSLSFSFRLSGTSSGPPAPPPPPAEGAAERNGTAAITVPTVPVSTSTTRVLLASGGELVGRAPRFFRAFPSAAAVAAVVRAVFFVVFFDGASPARGDVAVSPMSVLATVSVAAFLSATSRCLGKPSHSSVVNLKNSNTRFIRDPFSSATMSLYSFGDTGPRIKSS
jgi:hypothetical protein